MGHVTGWSYGWVVHTCYDYWVPDDNFWLHCNFEADFVIDYGDSGGPVFAPYNGGYMTIGMVWGKIDYYQWPYGPWSYGAFSGFRGMERDYTGTTNSGRFYSK
jgi:hypothetical protein